MSYDAQKITINISHKAFHTLQSDENSFDIIRPNRKKSDSKISDSLTNTIINNMDFGEIERSNTKSLYNSIHKSFTAKPNRDAKEKLDLESNTNYHGTFVSILLEEYTNYPYYKREEIIYKDVIRAILDAKANNQLIRISYRNKPYKMLIEPIDIMTDEWSSYNYLVGIDVSNLSRFPNGRIINLRICYISSKVIRVDKKNDYTLDLLSNDKIYEQIYKCGVQFVSENPITAKVRLESGIGNGKDMYDHMVFMRPSIKRYPTPEEPDVYTFECTRGQLRFYFFKFGSKAEILEPQSLRDEFCKEYEDALRQYQSN